METRNERANIEDELVAVFKDLLAELPPDTASLKVRRTSDGDGIIVLLTPRNPAAASITSHTEKGLDLVDFSFGDYEPTWELPLEGSNPKANKKELLQEVEQMCRAVIAGNCHHRRGLFSVSGIIELGGRPSKVTHW